MNDHVPKPVDPQKLHEVLVKWLPVRREAELGANEWSRATEVVTRLESLLATDDTTANDLFEQSRSLLHGVFGNEARRLGRQIQEFDYADALETLRAIRKARLIEG
jgi:hypothetical protein